jgi:DNA mismatch endonuclease (patch repair protein)
MVDVHTPAQRRANMSAIRGTDTKPELIVRQLIHALGFRYRLHGRKLPGKPDLVLTRHRKVIFVHGCFWHSHDCKYGNVKPATRRDFWAEKRRATVERDAKNIELLEKSGWTVLVVWECSMRDKEQLRATLSSYLATITS